MQNTELAKIKARIKALAEKTVDAGCSEHEAMAAAKLVGKLLEQYNLSMSEIDVREQRCVTIKIASGKKNRTPIDGCMTALGDFADCKVWFSGGHYREQAYYCFFGHETDTEMVQYLFDVISRAIDNETEKFKQTEVYRNSRNRRGSSSSFGHGMSARINARLRELKKEQEANLRAAEAAKEAEETIETEVVVEGFRPSFTAPKAKTGTALIVLKKQLVEQEFAKNGPKLRTAYNTRRISDYSGYAHGQAAGNRVNLSRPLDGGTKGYLK